MKAQHGVPVLQQLHAVSAALYATLGRLVPGLHCMSSVPESAPPQPAQLAPEALLNLPRLESYKRIGMLDELLDDYLPEMARLMVRLQQAAAGADRQASVDALHSLLGMSGEAGAQALYQQVRKIYVPLLEDGSWPGGSQWLPQLQELARRTEQALRAYCAAPAAPPRGR